MEATAENDLTQGANGVTPYGKACRNCARVKTKCTYHGDGSTCERCIRLKKDCLPSVPQRRRNLKKTPAGSTRTAQLEEKLNDIVSLLRSQSNPQTASHPDGGPLPATQTLSLAEETYQFNEPPPRAADDDVADILASFARLQAPTPESSSQDSAAESGPTPFLDIVSTHKIPDATAEGQLDFFRRTYIPSFPFVYIPHTVTAAELKQQRPFLWLVIMSLTTKYMAQQITMRHTISRIISQKVVGEHEKNFDILLGLICFMGWYQYHKRDKAYMIMWTQILVALAFELGINKSSGADESQAPKHTPWFPRIKMSPIRTMEERRAILSVYIISSIIWTGLRQMEPPRWTKYMDDCIRVLREEPETPLDSLLAFQAKCHVVMDKITLSPVDRELDGEGPKSAPAYFVRAMQSQLQDAKALLPIELQSSRAALLYFHGTELVLKEAGINRPRVRDQTGLADIERLEGLDSLLTSIERWQEVHQSTPIIELAGVTWAQAVQTSHCIVLLYKLNTIEEPGWDLDELSRRANLLDLLDATANRLELVAPAMGLVDAVGMGDHGVFFNAPAQLRYMRASFAADLAARDQHRERFAQPGMPSPAAPASMSTGISAMQEDFPMYYTSDPLINGFMDEYGHFDL